MVALLGALFLGGLVATPASLGVWPGAVGSSALIVIGNIVSARFAERMGCQVVAQMQHGFGDHNLELTGNGMVKHRRQIPILVSSRYACDANPRRARVFGFVEDLPGLLVAIGLVIVMPFGWVRLGMLGAVFACLAIMTIPHRVVDLSADSVSIPLSLFLIRERRLTHCVDPPVWPYDSVAVALRSVWAAPDPQQRVDAFTRLAHLHPDRDDVTLNRAWSLCDVGRQAEAAVELSHLADMATDYRLYSVYKAHRAWVNQMLAVAETDDLGSHANLEPSWMADVSRIDLLIHSQFGDPATADLLLACKGQVQPSPASKDLVLELTAAACQTRGLTSKARNLRSQTSEGIQRDRQTRRAELIELAIFIVVIGVTGILANALTRSMFSGSDSDVVSLFQFVFRVLVAAGTVLAHRHWKSSRFKRKSA